ncbi:hypothetical protein UPYG_G00305750 [Umbra pygmaea]|uniref:Uncharacterized protein n=1 Tax=Umbra pygmaea TaxID=75934 RepID=A0ABD0VZG3_UMBPY
MTWDTSDISSTATAKSRQPERRAAINDEWVKDSLLKYVEFFVEVNVDRAIYSMGRFKSFTFLEMWQCFHQYIFYKENPPQDATPAKATSHSSWSDDALDDTLLVDALVNFESQGEPLPISTSQPASAQCPEKLLPSTSIAATAEHLKLSPLTTSEREKCIKQKKAKRSKKEKPQLPSLPSTSKAASSQRPEQPKHQTPLLSSVPGQTPPDVRPKEPPSTSNSQPVSAATLPQSDSPVELEGWMRPWEESNGIPFADIPWLKEDSEREASSQLSNCTRTSRRH